MRNHSGSIETQRNSCETTAGASKRNRIRETTAGASKRRPRPTACAVAARNLSGPPAEEARAGQKRPESARNHSGSIETQRNSRETTAGASKRNGIRGKPQQQRRNEGPAPPRAPLRPATYKRPPRRSQNTPEEAGIRAKPQREHRNATEFA